jgi:hypothetical protein
VLTDLQIAALIRDGHTRPLTGFSDGQGRRFAAQLELDEALRVQLRPRLNHTGD